MHSTSHSAITLLIWACSAHHYVSCCQHANPVSGVMTVAEMRQAAADCGKTQTARVCIFACHQNICFTGGRKDSQYLSASSLAPSVTSSKAAETHAAVSTTDSELLQATEPGGGCWQSRGIGNGDLPIPLHAKDASTTLPFLMQPNMRLLKVSFLQIEKQTSEHL